MERGTPTPAVSMLLPTPTQRTWTLPECCVGCCHESQPPAQPLWGVQCLQCPQFISCPCTVWAPVAPCMSRTVGTKELGHEEVVSESSEEARLVLRGCRDGDLQGTPGEEEDAVRKTEAKASLGQEDGHSTALQNDIWGLKRALASFIPACFDGSGTSGGARGWAACRPRFLLFPVSVAPGRSPVPGQGSDDGALLVPPPRPRHQRGASVPPCARGAGATPCGHVASWGGRLLRALSSHPNLFSSLIPPQGLDPSPLSRYCWEDCEADARVPTGLGDSCSVLEGVDGLCQGGRASRRCHHCCHCCTMPT